MRPFEGILVKLSQSQQAKRNGSLLEHTSRVQEDQPLLSYKAVKPFARMISRSLGLACASCWLWRC